MSHPNKPGQDAWGNLADDLFGAGFGVNDLDLPDPDDLPPDPEIEAAAKRRADEEAARHAAEAKQAEQRQAEQKRIADADTSRPRAATPPSAALKDEPDLSFDSFDDLPPVRTEPARIEPARAEKRSTPPVSEPPRPQPVRAEAATPPREPAAPSARDVADDQGVSHVRETLAESKDDFWNPLDTWNWDEESSATGSERESAARGESQDRGGRDRQRGGRDRSGHRDRGERGDRDRGGDRSSRAGSQSREEAPRRARDEGDRGRAPRPASEGETRRPRPAEGRPERSGEARRERDGDRPRHRTRGSEPRIEAGFAEDILEESTWNTPAASAPQDQFESGFIDDRLDDEPAVNLGQEGESELISEDQDGGSPRPRRRRRRGRGRSGRSGESLPRQNELEAVADSDAGFAEDPVEEADHDHEEVSHFEEPREEADRPRRRPHRERRPAPVAPAATDVEDGEPEDIVTPVDYDVPTWEEAISYLVHITDGDNHSRGGRRDNGRGRGPERDGGRDDRRPRRPPPRRR